MTLGLGISRLSLHHPAALRLVSSVRGTLHAASCGTPLHPERPFPLHLLCAQGAGDPWRQRWACEDWHGQWPWYTLSTEQERPRQWWVGSWASYWSSLAAPLGMALCSFGRLRLLFWSLACSLQDPPVPVLSTCPREVCSARVRELGDLSAVSPGGASGTGCLLCLWSSVPFGRPASSICHDELYLRLLWA